ncbi:MAG: hypothetical protein FK733_04625 [Asgard group archaeon]|nr:hypothetical protein [Asgard group archaeon]
MTLITTHVALESLVIWTLMGKKNREIFKQRLGLFTLLALFAALPDFDTFFFIHRTYFHSIMWPLFVILGVLCYLGYVKVIQKKAIGEKANLITRSIIIASMFLILHSILDLNPGPVLLFYPFDNRLYRLNVSMVWDLDSIFYFKSLKINWTSISFSEGINNSIFNLRPSERISLFGTEFIELLIGDFPIHFLSMLAWIVFFPGTAFVSWLQKREKPKNFFLKLKKFKNPLLGMSVLLLSVGLIMGPGLGLNRVETREETTNLSFSENAAYFGIARSFELDKNDKLTLQSIFAGNTSKTNLIAFIADQEQYQELSDNLTNLFEFYNNNTGYSFSWLTLNYQSIIYSFIDDSNTYTLLTQENQTKEISYTFNQSKIVYSIVMILDWNITTSYIVDLQMTNIMLIKRPLEFAFGLTFASLGLTSLLSLIIINRDIFKKEKHDEEQLVKDDS